MAARKQSAVDKGRAIQQSLMDKASDVYENTKRVQQFSLPMAGGTKTTIKGQTTRAQEAALREAGFSSETRGGDPKFSTWGKSERGRLYTRVRTHVWRADGQQLTAQDRRVIAKIAAS